MNKIYNFLLALIVLIPTGTFAQKRLFYSFSADTATSSVNVILKFKGSKTGKTVINLPNEWAGQNQLYNAITELKIEGKNVVFEAVSDSAKRTVSHKPNALITVKYTLKQESDDPLQYPKNYRAVIEKEYFQFTGYSLLVYPDEIGNEKIQVNLDWSELPKEWHVGNSFHAESRSYKGKVLFTDFLNSVYVAGDFRSYKTMLNGKPIYVAVRGNEWTFSDEQLSARIKAIISMERDFWNDYSEPYYFVSLIPFKGQGSANGTSLHQAFMLGMTYDQPLEDWLLAHEYFHRWNGTLFSIYTENEQEHAWFNEGFTEFYTFKLLLEKELISHEEYLAKVNELIAAYYLSPVKNIDALTQGKNFWLDPDYGKIPYKKGFVYALYLDNLIRRSSAQKYSLDNLMFDLYALSKSKDTLLPQDFLEIANRYAGQDISALHQKYIVTGETIPVEAFIGGKPASLEMTKLGTYESGFDIDATTSTGIVSGVIENSEAWKAGMRNGQKAGGYSIYYNNISYPIELTITENDVKKQISFYPMSVEKIDVPQFLVQTK